MDQYYERMELRVERRPWASDELLLHGWHVRNVAEGRTVSRVTGLTLVVEKPEDGYASPTPEAFMRLKMGEGQCLMDELWRAGLRPTEGGGSAGAMAAVQEHLKDMKAVAFTALDAALMRPVTGGPGEDFGGDGLP